MDSTPIASYIYDHWFYLGTSTTKNKAYYGDANNYNFYYIVTLDTHNAHVAAQKRAMGQS